jgi:hypothetical protein
MGLELLAIILATSNRILAQLSAGVHTMEHRRHIAMSCPIYLQPFIMHKINACCRSPYM